MQVKINRDYSRFNIKLTPNYLYNGKWVPIPQLSKIVSRAALYGSEFKHLTQRKLERTIEQITRELRKLYGSVEFVRDKSKERRRSYLQRDLELRRRNKEKRIERRQRQKEQQEDLEESIYTDIDESEEDIKF